MAACVRLLFGEVSRIDHGKDRNVSFRPAGWRSQPNALGMGRVEVRRGAKVVQCWLFEGSVLVLEGA